MATVAGGAVCIGVGGTQGTGAAQIRSALALLKSLQSQGVPLLEGAIQLLEIALTGVGNTVTDLGSGAGRPRWQADSGALACTCCAAQFTLTRRKHHCRLCGHVFCSNCSAQSMVLPSHVSNDRRPQRVCVCCYVQYTVPSAKQPLTLPQGLAVPTTMEPTGARDDVDGGWQRQSQCAESAASYRGLQEQSERQRQQIQKLQRTVSECQEMIKQSQQQDTRSRAHARNVLNTMKAHYLLVEQSYRQRIDEQDQQIVVLKWDLEEACTRLLHLREERITSAAYTRFAVPTSAPITAAARDCHASALQNAAGVLATAPEAPVTDGSAAGRPRSGAAAASPPALLSCSPSASRPSTPPLLRHRPGDPASLWRVAQGTGRLGAYGSPPPLLDADWDTDSPLGPAVGLPSLGCRSEADLVASSRLNPGAVPFAPPGCKGGE